MPELPAARRSRLVEAWGISETDARTLVAVDGLADYAEAVAALGANGRDVAIWTTQDVQAHLNATGASVALLDPATLAETLALVADGTISRNQARDVLSEALRDAKLPRAIVEERGLAQVSDSDALSSALDAVLAANADAVAEFRAGDDKVRKKKRGFLMGEAMKALKGQGNPQVLNALLDEKLAG